MPASAAEVANLIVALKLDDSGFSGKLNRVAGQLRGLDSGLSQVGRGVGQVGGGLLRLGERAAIAAAGGLTAVVTTAASYEQSFTGIRKTVDATEQQFGELEDTIKRMSASTGTSFEELASIGETGGALGIATSDLEEFIDVVDRLSVSTPLSADEAATALGQLGNILGFTGDDFEKFSDSLVALGNAGASTEDQIVGIAARFGAAAKSAGLSNESILALSSTVASMGIEVEAGGGALSRVFNNITTDIATSSDEAKAMASQMGLSLGELRDAWDKDAGRVFGDLLETLSKMDQFEAASFLKDIGVTNTRDINALRNLSQGFDEYNDQLDTASNATGALNQESDKFFGTTPSQWKQFIAGLRNSADTIGQQLLPIVNEQMGQFTEWLSKPETQQAIKAFGEDLAQGLGDFIDELKGTDFSGLLGGLQLAAQVAKGAFDAFRALPEPVQQLAIAALVANKVSGGAIGQIAKGLGNIAFGGAKIGAGLFGMRGATPANPLFVADVGGGLGGIGGVGGKGGMLGKLGKLLGPAAAAVGSALLGIAAAVVGGVTIGGAVGGALNAPVINPAKGYAQGAVQAVLASGDAQRISDAIATIDDQLNSQDFGQQVGLALSGMEGWPVLGLISDALGNVKPELERNRDALSAALEKLRAEARADLLANADTLRSEGVMSRAAVERVRQAQEQRSLQALMQAADADAADRNLASLVQRTNELNSRTANATEAVSLKSFDPKITVDTYLTNNISVSASQVYNSTEVYTAAKRQSDSGGSRVI